MVLSSIMFSSHVILIIYTDDNVRHVKSIRVTRICVTQNVKMVLRQYHLYILSIWHGMSTLSMIIPHFMLSNLIFSNHYSFLLLHCTVLFCPASSYFVRTNSSSYLIFILNILSLLLLLDDLSYFYHYCYYHSYSYLLIIIF